MAIFLLISTPQNHDSDNGYINDSGLKIAGPPFRHHRFEPSLNLTHDPQYDTIHDRKRACRRKPPAHSQAITYREHA
jgi:hypothetical protein